MMNTATRTAAKKETIWSTFGITTMALMTTMLIVSTYIKIPLPFSSASITAQTLVVNLIGMLFAPLQIVAIMVSWLLLSVEVSQGFVKHSGINNATLRNVANSISFRIIPCNIAQINVSY